MEVRLDVTKSVQENAAAHYEAGKKLREKAKGAEKAITETKKKLAELEKKISLEAAKPPPTVRVKREKQWFEKFKWFTTGGGKLVVAGSDAKQNEVAVARYLEAGDLFFHAEIHGAPATILKGGQQAAQKEKEETAQFAASHSSGWKTGAASVDVYAVKPEQVSKRTESGESVGKGGFIIRGEREWFRNTPLGLLVGVNAEGRIESAPISRGKAPLASAVEVTPGRLEKGEAARKIAAALKRADAVDDILQAIPGGSSAVNRLL